MTLNSIVTATIEDSQIAVATGTLFGAPGDTAIIHITQYNTQMAAEEERPEPVVISLTIEPNATSQQIVGQHMFRCSLERVEVKIMACSPGAYVNLALNGGNL